MIGAAPRRWLTVLAAGLIAAGVCVAVLAFAGGIPDPGPVDLDPGNTPWVLPLARLAMDCAAVATVGFLLAAAFLLPGEFQDGGHRLVLSAHARHRLHHASWAAVAWALAAAASTALTASDLLGIPVSDAATSDNLYVVITELATGKALAVVFVLSLVIATGCQFVRTVSAAGALAVLAVVTVLPPTFTGHASTSVSHELATSSMMLHVVPAVLWAGGLLALLVGRHQPTRTLATAASRFSRLALVCFVLVAVSGVVAALVRVNSVDDLFTRYGVLLGGKLTALVVLGGFGWWHRRATLPALAAGRRRAFVRVAGVEVLVLAATFGLATGLARTPQPSRLRADELLEIPLRRAMEWLPDLVFLTIAVAAVAGYLAGVRRLGGHRWPPARTAAWIAGWTLVVAATDLQLARTGAGMFGLTDRVQHLTIGVVAPLLLAVGRGHTVARLALRPSPAPAMRGPTEWLATVGEWAPLRPLTHPIGVVAVFASSVYALYLSVEYSFSLTSHAAHLSVYAGTLAAGTFVACRLLNPGLREAVRITLGFALFALVSLLVLVQTISVALPSSLAYSPGRAIPPSVFTGQWVAVTCLATLAVWIATSVTAEPEPAQLPASPGDLALTDVKNPLPTPRARVDAQTPNPPRRPVTVDDRTA